MVKSEKTNTDHSTKTTKDEATYCELCQGTTHTKETCLFGDELEDEEPSDPDLDIEFLNDPEDSSTLVEYGTEMHTITGVMRVMRAGGNEEGAELFQQMDEVAKKTRRLYKTTKKKTGRCSTEDIEKKPK